MDVLVIELGTYCPAELVTPVSFRRDAGLRRVLVSVQASGKELGNVVGIDIE
jgi:hypothetical protein